LLSYTNIQPILKTANFFQRNFKIFFNSLKIKEKKTAPILNLAAGATQGWA
jgi:hypothetical protein